MRYLLARRVVLVPVLSLVLAAVLAACSSSSSSSASHTTTTTTTTTTAAPSTTSAAPSTTSAAPSSTSASAASTASAVAQITANWEAFLSGATPAAKKIARRRAREDGADTRPGYQPACMAGCLDHLNPGNITVREQKERYLGGHIVYQRFLDKVEP